MEIQCISDLLKSQQFQYCGTCTCFLLLNPYLYSRVFFFSLLLIPVCRIEQAKLLSILSTFDVDRLSLTAEPHMVCPPPVMLNVPRTDPVPSSMACIRYPLKSFPFKAVIVTGKKGDTFKSYHIKHVVNMYLHL